MAIDNALAQRDLLEFFTMPGPPPHPPFVVDATMRERDAALSQVPELLRAAETASQNFYGFMPVVASSEIQRKQHKQPQHGEGPEHRELFWKQHPDGALAWRGALLGARPAGKYVFPGRHRNVPRDHALLQNPTPAVAYQYQNESINSHRLRKSLSELESPRSAAMRQQLTEEWAIEMALRGSQNHGHRAAQRRRRPVATKRTGTKGAKKKKAVARRS